MEEKGTSSIVFNRTVKDLKPSQKKTQLKQHFIRATTQTASLDSTQVLLKTPPFPRFIFSIILKHNVLSQGTIATAL